MTDHRKAKFGHARAHEMPAYAAEELEALEENILYNSRQMEALMERVANGDQEAWEKVTELQQQLAAKQDRRNSI